MLGLIVGESSLPNFVINKLLKKNIQFLILDLTKSNIYKKYKNSHSLKITELGKAISILKKKQLQKCYFYRQSWKTRHFYAKIWHKSFILSSQVIFGV